MTTKEDLFMFFIGYFGCILLILFVLGCVSMNNMTFESSYRESLEYAISRESWLNVSDERVKIFPPVLIQMNDIIRHLLDETFKVP